MGVELGVPVADVAPRLGVTQRRVRAMIAAGRLDARKVGGRWLVERGSLTRAEESRRPRGRAFAPANAWAILLMAAARDSSDGYLGRLSPSVRSRARAWLRKADLLDLAPRLRGRARVLRLRAHSSDLSRIAAEPGLVATGVGGAAEHRLDIAAPGVIELYAPARIASRLVRTYALEASTSPNVILHVVDGVWPFGAAQRVAPGPVAALDLVDHDDERTRRAGREYLTRLSGP